MPIIPILIGGASAYILGRDSASQIWYQQSKMTKNDIGQNGADLYMNQLSAGSQSATMNGLQKNMKNMYLNDSNYKKYFQTKNTFQAILSTFTSNILQTTLTVTSLIGGLSKNPILRMLSWCSAGLLALQGVLNVGSTLPAIGKSKTK